MPIYRVVQPWGRDRGRQASVLSQHVTVTSAFAAIDAMRAQMVRTGTPSDALDDLVVADEQGNVVPRPTH
jgi:hypothetical protein